VRRTVGTTLLRLAVAALTLASVLATSMPSASAVTTPQIEAKKRDAAAAQKRLDDLADQLEMRSEEYEQIQDQLAQTRVRIAETSAQLEEAQAELDAARATLSDRAARIYRTGQVSFIDVVFGVHDFPDLISCLDFLRQVARSDAAAVSSVKVAVQQVEGAERTLETREAEESALREQARIKKAEVQKAVNDQRSYLNGLNAEVAELVREERERQARIAAERARRAAAAAAAAAAARKQQSKSAASERRFDGAALGAGHPEVVSLGLKYVGVPYVWGGSSPEYGFDCSGLTQYVYAEAGISISRSSRSQFAEGAFIPPDRLDLLQPGDLVFFGYDADPGQVHHVGIYVGGGNFLHAPQTGEDVQVSSLMERIAARADFVGGCRF
jgi:cell wall-associated NlpC family hydrolase